MKKMTIKPFEKSMMDKKSDKKMGKKEGSVEDKKADMKEIKIRKGQSK